MASNEEIMDTLGILQNHIINVESGIEDVKASRQEALEMNEYDRNVIMKNISDFEQTMVNNLKDVIIQQQSELRSYNEKFNEKLNSQNHKNREDAEALYHRVEQTTKKVCDLNSTVRDAVNTGFGNLHLKEEINAIMNSSIKASLENQTKANEKAVIRLCNTAVQMRDTFKNNIYAPFAYAGMILIVLFFAVGFKCHELYQNRICENVFEQFYTDKFNKEIEVPLKEAEKKAKVYLSEQNEKAEVYRKEKEKEADLYLKNKLNEADAEFEKRLQAYVDNAKKEVSNSMKKKKGDD